MAYRSTTLSIASPNVTQLAAFRTAAAVSVTDSDLDVKLCAWLKEGMIRVQDYYGQTLLAGTIQVEVDERLENDPIRLNGTIDTIVSVKDGQGNNLNHLRKGRLIYFDRLTDTVVITYTTKVISSDASWLQGMAERYALCRYDGDTEEAAAKAVMGGRYVW